MNIEQGNAKHKKLLIVITPVVLYLFLILNGILGVDFGNHWDEWFFITQASNAIDKGTVLPSMYGWPSFGYFIVLPAEVIYKFIFNIEKVLTLNTDNNFKIYLRVIFLMISSLTVIWVYRISLAESKNYLTALIAGLLILSSFEFSYHSRWVVTDCLAVQFTFLSASILLLDLDRNKKIILSSIIGGIAMGTKYTAAISSLNIIFFILLNLRFNKPGLKEGIKEIFLFLFVFSISFIITTPGFVLDNAAFMRDINDMKNQYSGIHVGHTVLPGVSHFSRISEYVVFELFSKNPVISFSIFVFSVIGFAWVLFNKKWMLSGLFVTMIIYVFYISTYGVMIVRNLLYVFPFLVLFASLGFHCIITMFQFKKAKYIFATLALVTLTYSSSIVFSSSLTIKNKSDINLSDELNKYLKQNTDKHFVFSKRVLPLVEPGYKNIRPSEGSYLVFFLKELSFSKYTANIRNQFVKVINMEDVNINYYPTWIGDDRILIMKFRYVSEDLLNTAFDEENFALPDSSSYKPWILKATFAPTGIYSPSNIQSDSDKKLKAFTVNSNPPFNILDSAKSKLDSSTLTAKFTLANKPTEEFYLVLKHLNNLESWSKLSKPDLQQDTIKYTFVNSDNLQTDDNPDNRDSNLIYIDVSKNFESNYALNLTDLIKLNNSDDLLKMVKP